MWKPRSGNQDVEARVSKKNDSRRRFVNKGSGDLEKNDSRRRFVDKGSGELPSRSGLKGVHKRRCL